MKPAFTLLLVFFFLAAPSWGDVRKLTLEECVRTAIARNQALQSASADVRANEAKIVQARAPLLPNLSLFYNLTKAENPLGAPIHASFGTFQSAPFFLSTYKDGVSLAQLLYDGGKTASLLRQQEALTQASRESYLNTAQTIAFNAISAFYQLAINRKLVSVSQENLHLAEEHLKLAEARYKAGVSPRSEVIFAKVPVASARLNLTEAQEAAKIAEASLNRILAYDVTTPILLTNLSDLKYSVSEEEAFKTALKNRNEIKQVQSVVESARQELHAARGSLMPVVSAVANYGYTDYGDNVLPKNLGYNFGLQGTLSLFEGNLQTGQVAEAKALLDKSLASLDSAKQDVLLDVRSAFLSSESAKESTNEAKTELASALENLHAVEGEYKAGLIPILNLTDAENSYLEAENKELSTHLNEQIAVARLLLAIGIHLEDLHAIIQSP